MCVIFLCIVVTIILLVVNTCFLCVVSQMGKHVVCGMGWCGGWCVFLCHPIFFPPHPTIFVNILYIFFCS